MVSSRCKLPLCTLPRLGALVHRVSSRFPGHEEPSFWDEAGSHVWYREDTLAAAGVTDWVVGS